MPAVTTLSTLPFQLISGRLHAKKGQTGLLTMATQQTSLLREHSKALEGEAEGLYPWQKKTNTQASASRSTIPAASVHNSHNKMSFQELPPSPPRPPHLSIHLRLAWEGEW